MEKNINTQLRFLLSNRESLALMEAASFHVLNLFQDFETSSRHERYSGQQEGAPEEKSTK